MDSDIIIAPQINTAQLLDYQIMKLIEAIKKIIKKIIYFSDLFFPIYIFRLRALRIKYNKLQNELDCKTERYDRKYNELSELYENARKIADDFRSSIEYAKTIQEAVLPLESNLNRYFKSFIFYQPKDIISGDFYWISKNLANNEQNYITLFVLADCTGHGVPGALLTLIGERLINEAVYLKNERNPSNILQLIHSGIQSALQQKVMESREGMDAAVCYIEKCDENNFKINYSGAKHNLIYYKKATNSLEIIKGDRNSIGGFYDNMNSDKKYTEHQLIMNKGDRLFFYTDGVTDQFNKYGKKFSKKKLIEVIENDNYLMLDKLGKTIEFEWRLHKQFEKQLDDVTVIGIEL